jgi:protoheme IX farnesyltransferase
MINYYLLTKPKIVLGNLVTLVAGFLLASKGAIDLPLFLAAFVGLSLIMASACVLNNYIDRHLDSKMERTKNRPLVTGLISARNALLFALILEVAGNLVLWKFTNVLTVVVAGIGFFVYVVLYSLWKSRTIYGTAIGSISGAIPPIVGYCAVSNRFDVGAAIFFMMLVLWQMPHFFAIAVYRLDDYTSAKIPVLPVMRGMARTKVQSIIYIAAFIGTAALLTFFNYTGTIYLITVFVTGAVWLGLAFKGFITNDDHGWGRQMFHYSLVLITAICLVIPLDIV